MLARYALKSYLLFNLKKLPVGTSNSDKKRAAIDVKSRRVYTKYYGSTQ